MSTPPIRIQCPFSMKESVCEQAARILFLNIAWVKDISSLSLLSMEDQLVILEASWRDLFLLSASQCYPPFDPTPIVTAEMQMDLPSELVKNLALEVKRFKDIIDTVGNFQLDQFEYNCAKSMVLYKAILDIDSAPSSNSSTGSMSPGISRLKDPSLVLSLKENAQNTLCTKMATSGAYGPLRYSKFLMTLSNLKEVSPKMIEELFFRRAIGPSTSIDKVICDVYTRQSIH